MRDGGEYTPKPIPEYLPFPGEIIVTGNTAEGAAGRMGHHIQHIFVVKPNMVWRTVYNGRMYGDPTEHYYSYNGINIDCITANERDLVDTWRSDLDSWA
jgi:hypothetical protein